MRFLLVSHGFISRRIIRSLAWIVTRLADIDADGPTSFAAKTSTLLRDTPRVDASV
jgi:hypothetical protein